MWNYRNLNSDETYNLKIIIRTHMDLWKQAPAVRGSDLISQLSANMDRHMAYGYRYRVDIFDIDYTHEYFEESLLDSLAYDDHCNDYLYKYIIYMGLGAGGREFEAMPGVYRFKVDQLGALCVEMFDGNVYWQNVESFIPSDMYNVMISELDLDFEICGKQLPSISEADFMSIISGGD